MRISIGIPVAAIVGISAATAAVPTTSENVISSEFAKHSLKRVDEIIRKHFWDEKAMPTWQSAFEANQKQILEQRTISSLDKAVNQALRELHASHTQYVTDNDEAFYFLRALFFEHDKKKPQSQPPKIDLFGAITGGGSCKPNEVRYVLDGSPAADAHVRIGDQIVSVDGAPYIGQLSFKGLAGKPIKVKIKRGDGETDYSLKLTSRNDLEAYIEAAEKSVRTVDTPDGKIGYVHVWCGGSEKTHDAIEQAIEKLQHTDGLILDLRDGYGGNFFDDLDFLYRPSAGYPPMTTKFRSGKTFTTFLAYSNPVVVLINGGSRSGKELMAYSLKKTGRATLVGETTAGYVLAGRPFEVNDRSSLYCAVAGVTVNGDLIEGKGVSPDIEVKTTCAERGARDTQYDEALRVLREKIVSSKNATKPQG